MNLWLDDWRNPPEGYIWAKTAQEAIQHLKTGKVTFISLDYNLDDYIENGAFVAEWIKSAAQENLIPKLVWAIHSNDSRGSYKMEQIMKEADNFWYSWKIYGK